MTKKRVLLGLAVLMVGICMNLNMICAKATGTIVASGEIGKIEDAVVWQLDSEGVLTISGEGDMLDFATYDAMPWCSKRSSIVKVVVEEGVTNVGNYAFYDCGNLETISLPEGITKIGKSSFYNCVKLGNVIFPETLKTIGDNGFCACIGLDSIVLTEKVTSIGFDVFSGCENVKTISLPQGLKEIGGGAFSGCTSFETISLPGSVETLKQNTFHGCSSLTRVRFSKGLVSIEESVFRNCSSLERATLPDGIKTIGWTAFQGCSKMRDVYLPEGIEKIQGYAFDECEYLGNISVPASVTTIGERAFGFNARGYSYYGFTITGYHGTAAETYAKNNNITFNAIECEEHTWDDGKVTVATTCTKDGEMIFTCTVCKDTKTEVIKTPGHQLFPLYNGIPAGCFEDGKESDQKCKVCHLIVEGDPIPFEGHQPISSNNGVEATCMEEGKESDTKCAVCGQTLTSGKILPAKGHVPVDANNAVEPTCDKQGKESDTKCSSCQKVLVEGKQRAALGHKEVKKVTKATTDKNGKITYTCSACNKETKTSTIIYAASKISLEKTVYVYDGKAKKPTVTVKDSKGKAIATTSYSVSYDSGRKDVGAYKVKVTLKGNYTGSKSLSFSIQPKSTTLKTLTPASKAFTVAWAKQTIQVDGYEIQYCTSDKFTSGVETVAITKNSVTSKKIGSLKAKKKYFVRICTYKKVGTKKYYSDWSAIKNVTTK